MGNYSIAELERLSGIRAHTIRIWEKRYKLISPRRKSGNVRLYSEDDLKRVINVAALNGQGIKISKIASMTGAGINKAILDMIESRPAVDLYINQLIVAMLNLEEGEFEDALSGALKKFGFEEGIMEVVYVFLERIGVLWQTGSITPAHEHFISNLIRQKLITAIASLPLSSGKSRRVILFLPEGELHELGLLFSHYLTRARGFHTYYLGQSVPYRDLKVICNIHKPEILITSMTSSPPANEFEKYIKLLSTDFPQATILVSGLRLRTTATRIPKNVKPYYKASDLPALLKEVS
jgi:DNA-binding transcriptional MerR regulator